jgi:hypothetical protein
LFVRRSAFGVLILLTVVASSAEPRPGTVQLSNGEVISGAIALVSGGELKFHDGKTLFTLDFATLRELRLLPEKEELVRHFRMPEPGRAFREEIGKPYPLRTLKAQAVLGSGVELRGHLYVTALVVETAAPASDPAGDGGSRRKIILPAKQQGEEGTALVELVYPIRIAFADVAAGSNPASGRMTVRISGGADELGAAARDGLAALTTTKAADGSFQVDSPLGTALILAARRGANVVVSWPGPTQVAAGEDDLTRRMATAVTEAKDYFDDRRLVGVWRPEGGDEVFTLVLLVRRAPGTNGPRQPWHVDVWRWRLDPDGARMLLAGRVTLLRGLAGKVEEPPAVARSMALWATVAIDGVIEATP